MNTQVFHRCITKYSVITDAVIGNNGIQFPQILLTDIAVDMCFYNSDYNKFNNIQAYNIK